MNAFASYHVQKALAIKQDFLVLYYREIKYTECRVMKYIKSIFAVSIVAMAVVGNARASIVSQTNIVGGSNVSVTVPTSGNNAGKVVISATDTNTTYSTGTTTYSGTTKLYTGTGSATDGTLTQKAITSALSGKLSTSGTAAKATADASGNVITTTYATKTELGTKQDKLNYTAENTANKVKSGGNMESALAAADADTKYPTLKAAMEIANIAAGGVNDKLGQLASKDTVYADLIDTGAVTSAKIADGTIATADLANSSVTTVKIKDANVTTDKVADGAITSAKIADGTIAEADLSDAVKTKLNATVQTFNPATATPGKYVTNFTKNGTTVTATTAYVQIPVGSATASSGVASIWVE